MVAIGLGLTVWWTALALVPVGVVLLVIGMTKSVRSTLRARSRSVSNRVRPDQLERRLRERLDALGPAPRAELLHVLLLPDLERAERIGEFWSYPQSRAFAELLIDCEEDRMLRAVLVGMLRQANG